MRNRFSSLAGLACLLAASLTTSAKEPVVIPRPHPIPPIRPPVIHPVDLRANEKPIAVEKSEAVVEENAYFKRMRASFTFTNPNARTMQGDFEFPIPEGAFVCGYALEINGEMVPGVVCEKEKARVAFENEVRKGVDPGLVEQVKGNVWKTRIFPLNPQTPRKAEVEYVVEKVGGGVGEGVGGGGGGESVVYERDGDDVFCARLAQPNNETRQTIKQFSKGAILWDASLSRLAQVAADRAKLAAELPETGDWQLVVFANEPSAPRAFTAKGELLKAIDEVVYDGGTDIAAAMATTTRGTPVLIFTDEVDTLAEKPFDLDGDRSVIVGSRPAPAQHTVEVRKVTKDEPMPKIAPKPSKLLASVWAARRMQDLATQADARKDEFLALGRKYGVTGPGLSLIVLERLDQYLEHRIEPPAHLAIHAEWVKRRAAEDDPIAAKKAQADHEAVLLKYWEERVKWWNAPKPPRQTPKSGLFDGDRAASGRLAFGGSAVRGNRYLSTRRAESVVANEARAEVVADVEANWSMRAPQPSARAAASAPKPAGAAGSGVAPSVTLKAWDPKTPYVAALKAAPKGGAYAVYLKERATYKDSPAFYLDCAGWFFTEGETETALRVISNLAEFRLENVALWRTMGWRLREAALKGDAKTADLAVRAFRKALALRGEEGQSRRDLATVLAERGKRAGSVRDLEEALALLHEAAFVNHARRATRRSNDFQASVFALEELNGLLAWCAANEATVGAVKAPAIDAAYRRDLPVKLRIVLSWDADETDIDLHVLEPNGEEAFYGNRRTAEGGFVSEDVTTGYGPEEYLKKDLETGVYRVLTNYYASHQTTLTGATTVQATVYTDWGTDREKMQILTLRLDKPKDKVTVGEIRL